MLAASLALLASCATTSGLVSIEPAAALSLHAKSTAPSQRALELAERFYAGALTLDEAEAEHARLVASEPDSAVLHEVAGYAAMLRGDVDATWEHFLEAAQDPRAPLAELYLEEALLYPRTASQRKATIAFLDELVARHPSGGVRARAAWHLGHELVRHDRVEDLPRVRAALGFLDDWLVVGSFDNDQGKGFLTRHPPEEKVDIGQAMQGARLSVGWREVELFAHDGTVPLGWIMSPSSHAAAYLATWVHVPADTSAELRLSTTTSARAWVNGALVLSEERVDRLALDNLKATVALERGWNEILIKSATRAGEWALGARLTDDGGAPLAGVTTSRRPEAAPRVASSSSEPAARHRPGGVERAEGEARRAFLEGRASMLMGHVRPAVSALQSFVEQHGASLPGIYYAAVALWQDEEQGRALDLVNLAVKRTGEKVPRFLQKRASFYVEKQLYDKAQADLWRVREMTKRAREAEVELAGVLAKRGFHVDRCRVLDGVLARWPDDAWTLREAGLCWEARGFGKRSEELYRRARSLEPGHAWGLGKLRELATERLELDDAVALARQQQRVAPERLGNVVDEGDLLRWRGDLEEARAAYERAAKLSPDWSRPRELLGTLAREQGDEALALEHLRAAYERDPDDNRLADLLDFLEPKGNGLAERYAPGSDEIEAAIARAKGVEAHPGSQVVVLLDDEVSEVSQEGSAKRIVTSVSLAVNKQGRDELIQARVPVGGKVRILHAYSVRPDGERQEAASIRGGVVRFRSLDVGSVVVVQYVHYARGGRFLPNHYVEDWYFQGIHRQVERSRWVLILPKERKLALSLTGEAKQSSEVVGNAQVRTFLAEQVPPLVPERFMPPARDRLWRVAVSTVGGWDEYVQWERALLSQVFRLDADTDALAKKLTAGASTKRERLDRLFHYVAEEIRYQQDYEDTIAGVRPHACPVVLSRGYGDCKDKSVLLILLAKQVGIDVDFAILRTTDAGKVERAIPNQQFNHAIVYVPAQEGIEQPFFMDPTTDGLDMGNLRGDDQGATSLVLDPDSGAYRFVDIPYSPPSMERTVYRYDVQVSSSKAADVSLELELRGGSASSVRQLLRNPEQAKKFFQGLAMRLLPGALVTRSSSSDANDIWQPLAIELALDAGAALGRQGDDVRLPLPDVFPLVQTAQLAERQHPIRLSPPDSYRQELAVRLPPGSRVTHLPADVSVHDPCFVVERKATQAKDVVTIEMDYTRTCTEIPVEDYGRFRESVQRAQSELADPLLFRLQTGKLAGR